jgi:DNA-binding beta-propeller fold protein YncE
MLIADPQQSRVLRFTTDGDYIGEIGRGRGTEPGYFDGPRDITTDPEGNIYVADGNNCRLQAFDSDGELLSCVGAKGSGPCEFLRPHSLDVGPDGNIYLIDVDNSRVTVHDKMGALLRSWGREGKRPEEFWAPHGIAVDPNGDVIVADFYGRCQRFTGEGELLDIYANPSRKSLPAMDPSFGAMSLGHGDPTHGYYRYHAMTSDHLGNVYLMSRNMLKKRSCSVDKYNGSGNLVAQISLPPEAKRKMGGQGAAVSKEGRLYVSDTGPTHAGVMIFDPE